MILNEDFVASVGYTMQAGGVADMHGRDIMMGTWPADR